MKTLRDTYSEEAWIKYLRSDVKVGSVVPIVLRGAVLEITPWNHSCRIMLSVISDLKIPGAIDNVNEKSNVTKELNAKHRKRSSMGKRESGDLHMHAMLRDPQKSRSAHIKAMGNEKANGYWEAELPPNYDRVGIENFIRAKYVLTNPWLKQSLILQSSILQLIQGSTCLLFRYEDKRWIPKDGKEKSAFRIQDERATVQQQQHYDRSGHARSYSGSSDERISTQCPSTKQDIPAARFSIPLPPRGPEQVSQTYIHQAGSSFRFVPNFESYSSTHEKVSSGALPHQTSQGTQPIAVTESAKQVAEVAHPPKVDIATDLFDMLSMDSPNNNGANAASVDDNSWADFQSAQEVIATAKTGSAKSDHRKCQSASAIEDLFKDSSTMSSSVSTSSLSEKLPKDVKNDIMNLFDKQQLAQLAQQQALLIAAAAASGTLKIPGDVQQGPNGSNIVNQSWPHVGYQFPGMMMPASGKTDLEKYLQVGTVGATHLAGNSVPLSTSSIYPRGQNSSGNSVPSGDAATTLSSSSTQSTKEEDFSSLIQGMFPKR
ncbi:hypothetical protein RND71_034721 [Anisodus tanguticus]|uniref:Uncharacterized protein n=1 Tax=Anisodus tanguticus TaxID=243964 RepID=A0AAE1V1H1_9SOLA|nr:hypothetical protein RND71_034721 [Anisodus tanguticus]